MTRRASSASGRGFFRGFCTGRTGSSRCLRGARGCGRSFGFFFFCSLALGATDDRLTRLARPFHSQRASRRERPRRPWVRLGDRQRLSTDDPDGRRREVPHRERPERQRLLVVHARENRVRGDARRDARRRVRERVRPERVGARDARGVRVLGRVTRAPDVEASCESTNERTNERTSERADGRILYFSTTLQAGIEKFPRRALRIPYARHRAPLAIASPSSFPYHSFRSFDIITGSRLRSRTTR